MAIARISRPPLLALAGSAALAVLGFTLGSVAPAQATTQIGSDANFSYTYDDASSTSPAKVIGCASTCPSSATIPSVFGSHPVVGIASSAFAGQNFTSVSIPASVQTIGPSAFANNPLLQTLTIDNGVQSIDANAFSNATSLTSLVVPGTVESIGQEAFSGASNLTSLTLKAGIKSIYERAFQGMSKLTSLELPDSVTTLKAGAFADASLLQQLTLSNGLTSIPDQAFQNSIKLPSLTVPAGVATIGASAFADANMLHTLELPSTLMMIGTKAFINAGSLVSLTLPASVSQIGTSAFEGTNKLASLVVPSTVNAIGERAFFNAGSSVGGLNTLRFLGDRPNLGSEAFSQTGSEPIRYREGTSGWTDLPTYGIRAWKATAAPLIVTQPASVSKGLGQPVTLSVVAQGDGELSYLWFRNNLPLGSHGPDLSIPGGTSADSGSYTVIVGNWVGMTESAAATVVIGAPPVVVVPPPAAPPSAPATKAKQSIKLNLPAKLAKKKYPLPAKTQQGQRVTWKLTKNKFCKLTGTKTKPVLACTKSSAKKRITLTATAPGTATLDPLHQPYTRSVK